jgi:hypothetical protein
MSRIRESAKGEDCTIRIPGVCNGDAATVVLAHLPAMKMGGKSPDFQAAYACSGCHDMVDGRKQPLSHDKRTLQCWFFEGVIDTQKLLVEKGLLSFE